MLHLVVLQTVQYSTSGVQITLFMLTNKVNKDNAEVNCDLFDSQYLIIIIVSADHHLVGFIGQQRRLIDADVLFSA